MDQQQHEVTGVLRGEPTTEELQQLYVKKWFHRGHVAKELGISTQALNILKRKRMGITPLPSPNDYAQYHNVKTYIEQKIPEWARISTIPQVAGG